MQTHLFQFVSQHSPGFVVTSVVICLVGGWLLAALLARAETGSGGIRWFWLSAICLVAGIGVWTTHFVAMLGYRPDLLLEFNPAVTAFSALVGVVAVGIPLAISALTRARAARAALGLAAGAGVGAMHFAGMSAIEGCIQVQALDSALLGYSLSALCFAAARGLPQISGSAWRTALLVMAGVTAAHFLSISGVSLTRIAPAFAASEEKLVLSIFTAAGAAILFVGAFLSLLAAHRFDAQEKAHSAVLSTALHNMSNGLFFIGADEKLELFNDRLIELFSLQPGQLWRGMSIAEMSEAFTRANFWTDGEREETLARIVARVRANTSESSEFTNIAHRILEIESRPVQGGGTVFTLDDVTRDREAQNQIKSLAFNDLLTGLPNRRALQQRMAEGFSPKQRYKLLLIDLDHFKAVNDTFGHAAGDELLIQVAKRLRAAVGNNGFVARLGGDEMAALIYGDLGRATAAANIIVESIEIPFVVKGTTLSVGCSIGMCCTDDADTPEELMQRADVALFESKRRGRGQASCYRPGMIEEVNKRHQLERDLRVALVEGQFFLNYQPVHALPGNELIGYEALIRWQHPRLGLVPPATFIPLAEETGQIVDIGRWVLRQACADAASWPSDLHIAVNVSAAQFRSPRFMDDVLATLASSGLPARQLELELTETAIVQDGGVISAVLKQIRAHGIRIAMDDFGTGYSSLAHLRDLPLDRIKIDQSFVQTAETDRHSMAVLKAVTMIGQDLGIPTLAEGVETESQRELLRKLGCNAVQGYLTGRPQRLPANARHRLRA